MKIPRHIKEYLVKRGLNDRPLVASSLDGIELAVVIPSLAERDSLPATLSSLSRISARELGRTLVICVVNNRRKGVAAAEDIENNQETLRLLQASIDGKPQKLWNDERLSGSRQALFPSDLRLAYIDASSAGREMPDRAGGVGTARKIGMDAALTVFDYGREGERLLISLDADTLVEDNYLEAIRAYFVQKQTAAVVNFSHQRPEKIRERVAIYAYEVFLRYYVLGLHFAGSPYAFHTIGSTVVSTADAYCAVGGMNRRDGAEDFYFLNKMAKYRGVGEITATTVYPSARPSSRVPFGTGRSMMRSLEGGRDEFLLYDPRVFFVLKQWLDVMRACPDRKTAEIMTLAQAIDPLLFSFLEENDFALTWERIRKNAGRHHGLSRPFHFWFDGFKTMKLIRFLTARRFPRIDAFQAVETFLAYLMQDSCRTRSTEIRESCKTLSATLPKVSFFSPV